MLWHGATPHIHFGTVSDMLSKNSVVLIVHSTTDMKSVLITVKDFVEICLLQHVCHKLDLSSCSLCTRTMNYVCKTWIMLFALALSLNCCSLLVHFHHKLLRTHLKDMHVYQSCIKYGHIFCCIVKWESFYISSINKYSFLDILYMSEVKKLKTALVYLKSYFGRNGKDGR